MEESAVQGYLKSYVEAKTPEGNDDIVQLRNGHQSDRIICGEDVEAEVFEWILSHLDSREWPLELSTLLAKTVSQKLNAEVKAKEASNDCVEWSRLETEAREAVQGLCSLWLEQPHLTPPTLPLLPFPISTSAMRNGRRKMEDRHIKLPYFNYVVGLQNAPEHSYYAVFDGHAGSEAASYATAHLHHNIAKHSEFLSDPILAIKEGFATTERNFLNRSSKEGLKSGCTAVCCLLRETKGGKKLYVGWLGDSQAVLAREGSAITLVEPHKPDREDERQRIVELGGAVILLGTWRVNGALAVSRALGDAEHKPYISSDPDVISLDLNGTEDFLILGCDGLWDQLTPDDVTQHIYRSLSYVPEDAQYIACGLTQSACEYGSTDNITAIIVFLRDPKEFGFCISTGNGFSQPSEVPKHFAESELHTACVKPVEELVTGMDDSELRHVASEMVNNTIERALSQVTSADHYQDSHGELQEAQEIVEQVHQIHLEQTAGVHEELHHFAVLEEVTGAGIENLGFGESQSGVYGATEQDIEENCSGEIDQGVGEDISERPSGSPVTTDAMHNKWVTMDGKSEMEPPVKNRLEGQDFSLFQDFVQHANMPRADCTDSLLGQPLEFEAQKVNEEQLFCGGITVQDDESQPYPVPSPEYIAVHEGSEPSLFLNPDKQFHTTQPLEVHDKVESPRSDIVHNMEQPAESFAAEWETLNQRAQSEQEAAEQAAVGARPEEAAEQAPLPHEQMFTPLSDILNLVDLSSASEPYIASHNDKPILDLPPEVGALSADDVHVEATTFHGEPNHDQVELDVTESTAAVSAVSADSVVKKAEQIVDDQQGSGVIFCELKEPAAPENEDSANVVDVLKQVIGEPVNDVQETSQGFSSSGEAFNVEHNLEINPEENASVLFKDAILTPVAVLPNVLLSGQASTEPESLQVFQPAEESVSLQHKGDVAMAPIGVVPTSTEASELAQLPSKNESNVLQLSEGTVAPVELGSIPECVPEAEGVTEDSDSEKDGGWKFVKPSLSAATVCAAATAAAVTSTVDQTSEEMVSAPVVSPNKTGTVAAKAQPTTKSAAQKQFTSPTKPAGIKSSSTMPKTKTAADKTMAKASHSKPLTKKYVATKPSTPPASASTTRAVTAEVKKGVEITAAARVSQATQKAASALSRPLTAPSKVSEKPATTVKPKQVQCATLPARPKVHTSVTEKQPVTSAAAGGAKKPPSSTRPATTKTMQTTSAPSRVSTGATLRQTSSATTTKTNTTSRAPSLPKKPSEAAGATKPLTKTTTSAKLNKDSTNQQLSTKKNMDSANTVASRIASARLAATAASQRAVANKTLKQSAAKASAKQTKQPTAEGAATVIKPKKAIAQQNGICEEKGALEQQENRKGDPTETSHEIKEVPVDSDESMIQTV